MKLKHIILQTILMAGATWSLTSCNDFLDMAPLDQVTPQEYFNTTDHLAAYSISQYNNIFSTHGGYGVGTVNNDQNTDNMVAGGYSSTYFEKGQWRVPNTGGGWDFTQIRYCNYFFENVLPKFEAGKIEGNCEQILHYVGEMYFIRAWIYYSKLKSFGDFPIITEVLPDNQSVLTEKSVRQPRNLVARFIINQLDSAAKYMVDDISGNKTRLTKNCALLIKSRVALYEATFEKYHKGTDFAAAEDKSTDLLGQVLTLGDELFTMGLSLNTKDNDKKFVSKEDAYAHLFNSKDLSDMTEVVFWKKYSIADGVTHNLSSNLGAGYVDNSGAAGLAQSLIDNYLNADGSFIDPNDGIYKDFNLTFKERDARLLATVMHSDCKFKSTSPESKSKAMFVDEYSDENKQKVRPPYLTESGPARNATGYHIRMSIDTTYVSGQGETSLPIIRYAEALLAYAEAAEELDKCDPDVLEKTLKPLRERAGVTYTAPAEIDPNFTDFGYPISAKLQEIRRERRSELALQGFRLDDLMRWRAHKLIQGKRGTGAYFGADGVLYKAFDPKTAVDLKTILTTDGWLDPQKEVLPRGYQFDSSRDYLLPIPPSELSLNHELEQNPGWQRK